ncbi:hypothetical protein, partial [Testudinibacter sp. TR-2022]|uniref:hypothetical protein n=1 Tax=Testudinibacter sp. TR-2022 TaxID=2585029 RepID=UPI002279D5FB
MKKYIFSMFAIFDIFYLFIYFLDSVRDSKIPFYSDLLSLSVLWDKMGSLGIILPIANTILFLSLFLSISYYISDKWFGYYIIMFQLPLRIFCLLPSIPYSIYAFKSLFNLATIYSFCFLITLELSKVILIYLLLKNRNIK